MWGLGHFSVGEGSSSGRSRLEQAEATESLLQRVHDVDKHLQGLPSRLFEGRIDVKLESVPMPVVDDSQRARERRLGIRREQSQWEEFISNTELSVPTLLGLGAATFALGYGVYRRFFRRLPTAAHFTPSTLRYRRTIVGKCTSVGDADGFRLFHTPGPPIYRDITYSDVPVQYGSQDRGKSGLTNWFSKGNGKGKGKANPPHHRPLNSQTISIRIAGADAPELAHFGKPAQPFGKEAQDELKRLVLGKTVWCQIAHLDQYQRIVATPYVWRAPYIFGRTNVSLHLVEQGLATVYTQAGAAYGTAGSLARFMRWLLGSKDNGGSGKRTILHPRARLIDWLLPLNGEARLKRAMARAQKRRIGIWSQKRVETPEEYKKRHKEGG